MDIVERLRHAIEWHRGKDTNLLKNSADEIERLRETNKRLAEIATDAVEWLPPASVNGPREQYQNKIKELTDGHSRPAQ